MIERVRLLAQESVAISSVLMYGSFVKGEGDAYSDIEFYVFLHSGSDFDKKLWVNTIEETELFFVNEFGTDVAVFSNLVRGEFHFLDVSQIEIIKSWVGLVSFEYWEKMILVDKEKKLTHVLSEVPKSPPVRNTPENIQWIQYSFINIALFTKNLLQRKEWAHAHQNFSYLHKYLLWLIRIRVGSTAHWESPTKKAEDDLPPEWYSRFRECVPGIDKRGLKEAFVHCITLATTLFTYRHAAQETLALLNKVRDKV